MAVDTSLFQEISRSFGRIGEPYHNYLVHKSNNKNKHHNLQSFSQWLYKCYFSTSGTRDSMLSVTLNLSRTTHTLKVFIYQEVHQLQLSSSRPVCELRSSQDQQSVRCNLAAASRLARNQRFVPDREAGEGELDHSHVNNYRRVSNYKAQLWPADTYSSHVRAARDSFLNPSSQLETCLRRPVFVRANTYIYPLHFSQLNSLL